MNPMQITPILSSPGRGIRINGAVCPTHVRVTWDGRAWTIRESAQRSNWGWSDEVFYCRTDNPRMVAYHLLTLTR